MSGEDDGVDRRFNPGAGNESGGADDTGGNSDGGQDFPFGLREVFLVILLDRGVIHLGMFGIFHRWFPNVGLNNSVSNISLVKCYSRWSDFATPAKPAS